MKIVFVRPDNGSRFQINPPVNLGYLVAAVKKAGHDAEIIDAVIDELSPQCVYALCLLKKADLVGVSVCYGSENWAVEFIAVCRKIPVICGGAWVSSMGEKLASYYLANCKVLWGECEKKLPYYINNNFKESIFGEDNTVDDLDLIPIPDWQSIHPERYFKYLNPATIPTRGKRVANIISSRGCPYNCTFCASPVISSHKIRYRSISNIVEEIKYLKKTYGVDEIWFSDDNFTFDTQRAYDLCIALKPLNIHWRLPNGMRADRITFGLAIAMKESGCYCVGIGIESASLSVLKRVKKSLDIQYVEGAIYLLRIAGIKTIGFFITGLPLESEQEFRETIDYVKYTRLDRIQISTFTQYPGSAEWGRKEYITEDTKLSRYNRLLWAFYSRPRVIFSLLFNLKFRQLKAILSYLKQRIHIKRG